MTDVPKLYRVILQVSDLDRAEEFYAKLLGAKGRRVHGSRHYFDCGPVILALVDPRNDGEKARPNPDHVYFSVKDLETVHARAKRLGCLSKDDVHGEPAGEMVERPWGERSFYARDPFGNPLCFVDEKTLFTGR
ncbi:MAG: VOC family protein [Planctomycetota bacterium]